jgi:serine protease Do
MGLALQSITDAVRDDFRLAKDARGVLVMGIDPASDAASRGLNPGDRIVAVGSVEVSSLADINLALEKAKSMNRDSVLLFVVTAAGESTQKAVKLEPK